jgi:hypothetical protein
MTVTKSWALFASSSAMICSANPLTLCSRVSSISTLAWRLRSVRVSGSKFRLAKTGSLASPLEAGHQLEFQRKHGVTYPMSSASSPALLFRNASKRAFRASEAAARDITASEARGLMRAETRQLDGDLDGDFSHALSWSTLRLQSRTLNTESRHSARRNNLIQECF